MGSINLSFLNLLKEDINNFSIFIEGGTGDGTTILTLEPYFKKLYTIEISKKLYNISKNKYNGNKIKFYLNDSVEIFKTLLPEITDPCIMFLDAHYSGGDTSYINVMVPLLNELELINSLLKINSILIIDDIRLIRDKKRKDFNFKEKDILDILKDRISKYYYLPSKLFNEDRLIIHLNDISDN